MRFGEGSGVPMRQSEGYPNLYLYYDFRSYLCDWFEHRKSKDTTYRLTDFSKDSGILPGPLSSILKGDRNLTPKNLMKLSGFLKLSASEFAYFELLRQLSVAKKIEDRSRILERIKKFRGFERLDSNDEDVYQYLSKWYYVAIREMAGIQGFSLDPAAIQKKLRFKISLGEIREALEFLKRKGFLESKPDGTVRRNHQELLCKEGVYRVALGQFHCSMLDLVKRSFEEVPRNIRKCRGYTASIHPSQVGALKRLLDRTADEIALLSEGQEKPENSYVYHVGVYAIPLTIQEKARSRAKRSSDDEGEVNHAA